MKAIVVVLLSIISLLTVSVANAQVADSPEGIHPLLIGSKFPDVALLSTEGESVSIVKQAKIKPVVVIFYRGGWCPYCNAHFSEIAGVEKEILEAGFQIIAVSPDDSEHLQGTMEKNNIRYQLLSDSKGELIKRVGIAYKAPGYYKNTIKESSSNVNSDFIPLPSVYVIDKKGDIIFSYMNIDFKKRIKGNLLLTILKNLD